MLEKLEQRQRDIDAALTQSIANHNSLVGQRNENAFMIDEERKRLALEAENVALADVAMDVEQ